MQRIRETLARVELSDGLTFGQLIQETTGRLPRDASVVAVLADVLVETALTLGNLRRQGFALTVVLVAFDASRLERAMGRLLAEGIRDVRHLRDEASLPALCQQQVLGGSVLDLGQVEATSPYGDASDEWAERIRTSCGDGWSTFRPQPLHIFREPLPAGVHLCLCWRRDSPGYSRGSANGRLLRLERSDEGSSPSPRTFR